MKWASFLGCMLAEVRNWRVGRNIWRNEGFVTLSNAGPRTLPFSVTDNTSTQELWPSQDSNDNHTKF